MRIVPQSILCAGRPAVGEGHEQMENARAWYRGYEAAADAAANALLAAWAEAEIEGRSADSGGSREGHPYDELPRQHVNVHKVWLCSKDGLNYVSPRCGHGGTHRQVTVTTVETVTWGWDQSGRSNDG